MSRFGKELRVIPRVVWYFAFVVYFTFATLIFKYVMFSDPEFRDWPLFGKIALPYCAMLLVAIFILLIGYVYGDAKRRAMRYVLWTWLAILIPDAIGIILYFILRDPLPVPCPSCRMAVPSKFTFCPYCGVALKPTCPHCGKAAEPIWANCPHCGVKLPRQSSTPA
jgi:hypothetical protein